MTTPKTTATKTTAKRGMSNSADQDYLPDTGVITTPLVTPDTVVTVSTPNTRTRTVTIPGEVKSEVKTRSARKTDAETSAPKVSAESEVTIPGTDGIKVTPQMINVWSVMTGGVSGTAQVIADASDFTLPRVRAALNVLVATGVVTKTVATEVVRGKEREVESYALTSAPKRTTRARKTVPASPVTVTKVETPKSAPKVARTTRVPSDAELIAGMESAKRATPRKRAESVTSAPATASKGKGTKSAPATPEKSAQRPPRAPQTRPFADGEVRTHKVNGRVHVIGTPLNQDRDRHNPGGLQSEITAFLTESAGEWFKVSQIARGINNWEAQTGRTAQRLVDLGILEFDRSTGVKRFRVAPPQVSAPKRSRKR